MLLTTRAVKSAKAEFYALINKETKHGQIVFFGDSLTELFLPELFFRNLPTACHNRGIIGDTTTEMLRRLNGNVLAIEPSVLVILGGANDLNRNKRPRDVVSNLDHIITQTRTRLLHCNVIVQSLYPVNPTYRGPFGVNAVDKRTNAAVCETNRRLRALCAKRGVAYADVHRLLIDDEGNLKTEYALDGLHVNLKAYRVIADALYPYLSETPQPPREEWTEEYAAEAERLFRAKTRT